MKFPTTAAFDKHLKGAFPDHLAPIFMVVFPCDYERRKNLDKITELLRKKDPTLRSVRLSGLDDSLEQVKEEILTPSLWGGLTLVIYESADKVKNIAILGDLFAHFPPNVHLLLGASSFKPISELYQKGKKEIVVLDLSEEKPWEKERRLQEWVISEAAQQKKTLHSDVAHYLLQHLGPDLATLDQELAKLICYIGHKSQIELSDAQAVCGSRDLFTGWQLSEKIIWDRPLSLGNKSSDLAFLLPFLGQLRYQLQLGCRLADLLEHQTAPPDLKRHFPTLRPAQLDKLIPLAKARKSQFFQRGLKTLYDLEVAVKSSSLDLAVLFDYFQASLYRR